MTMRVVFLTDYEEYKPGQEAFIPRQKARVLCEEDKAVPYMTWADAEKKREALKDEPLEEPIEEVEKKPSVSKPKRKYKKREKAVTVEK